MLLSNVGIESLVCSDLQSARNKPKKEPKLNHILLDKPDGADLQTPPQDLQSCGINKI